jgi:NAD(P)-dependent dehydrogenase (short-subunit alcohol dehydrogenase family)
MEVVNKVAVITGGGSGIGRGIGLALAAAGADVVVADINLKNAEDVVKEIEALGRRAIAFQCDVTNQANVEALADFAWAEMDHVELVFNNAGVVVSGMAVESSAKDLLWTYSVNAFGVWYGTVAFTRRFIEKVGEHVVKSVEKEEFYIFTHPHVRDIAEQRWKEIAAAMDRQWPDGAGEDD